MTEFWGREACPKCNVINWYHLGNSDADGTKQDYDGAECWSCNHKWLFPEPYDDDLKPEDAHLTEGQKKEDIHEV